MKKLIKIFAFIAAFVCLTGLTACGKGERYINTEHTVGTFSGYRVSLYQVPFDGDVNDVTVEYVVGGIYISTLPDPSWEYVVSESDDERIYLSAAYSIGIISRDDIIAIAAAEAEYYAAQHIE